MTILYGLIRVWFGVFFIILFFTVNYEFQETNNKKLRIFIISYVE